MTRRPTKRRREPDEIAAEVRALTALVRHQQLVDMVRQLPPGRWVTDAELTALTGRRRRTVATGHAHGRRAH
jgi:hypothetical protein